MDDAPTARERILLFVGVLVVVVASLAIVLSRPEKEVPPVEGGRPGTVAAPSFEVTRSPAATGEQEVRVTFVVTGQVDGKPRSVTAVATGTIGAGEESTEVRPDGLDLPPGDEIGAVVQWFAGGESLGWTSVGLADPSGYVD